MYRAAALSLLDNGGTASVRAEELEIELLWLPKRAPELNPIEDLWGDGKDVVCADHQDGSIDEQVRRDAQALRESQRPDGAWVPLWFGNEHAADEENPVYGTSRVVLDLMEPSEVARAEFVPPDKGELAAVRNDSLLATSIQRLAASTAAELMTTVVAIPNNEIKGKIIGKEGRLELTGVKESFYLNGMLVKVDLNAIDNQRYLLSEMRAKDVGGS